MCARLLREGCRVVCVDDLSTGGRASVDRLGASAGYEFVEHDVCGPLPREVGRCDFVLNLACPASPDRYREMPVHTLRTCVVGTYNLLEAARSWRAPLLFTSTSEVYGNPLESPQRESYWGNVDPIGPRSCYDEGKRAAESLCVSYREEYGADVRVVRLFNVYGPGMDLGDGRVVSNFMVQALTGEPLTVYGSGLQTRSLCYVDDAIDALVRALECKAFPSSPINIGNPDERTVLELANAVVAATRSSSPVSHLPAVPGDPQRRKPEISLARSVLGWEPSTRIEEGLARCAEYYRAELGRGGLG